MWNIKLNESTSLSKETVGLCIANGVETLQNLFDYYFSESKFDNLKYFSDNNKSELIAFCEEIIHFIETRMEKREEEVTNEVSHKPMLIDNLSLEALLDQKFVSNRLFNAFKSSGLIDFQGIADHYSKYQTFLNLPRVGFDKNSEAKGLLEKYALERRVEESTSYNQSSLSVVNHDDADKSINWDNYTLDKTSFLEYLDQQKPSIANWLYNYFVRALAELKDSNFSEEIQAIYNSPHNYGDHIGTGKVSQIRNLIAQSSRVTAEIKQPSDTYAKKLTDQLQEHKIYVDQQAIVEFLVNSYNPLKLMDVALAGFEKMKIRDHIILNRLNAAKYFINDIRLSYEEVQDQLAQILGEEVPIGTFKPWVMRSKEHFAEFVNSFCTIIDSKEFILAHLEDHDGTMVLRDTVIHELNEKYGVSFAKPVYNLVVLHYLIDYLPAFDLRRDEFTNLYFLPATDFTEDELNSVLLDLKAARDKKTIKEIQIDLTDNKELLRHVKSILRVEQADFKTESNYLMFPPTAQRKPNKVDALISILEEEGEAMHYDDIVDEVNKLHPGLFLSYRAPKDSLHVSEKTMSLGGRSNYYILTSWKDKYFYGGLKDILIDYYEQQSEPRHLYNAYLIIKDKKLPPPPIEAVESTLLLLDEVFHSNKNKFFSLNTKNQRQEIGIRLNNTHHNFTDRALGKYSVKEVKEMIAKQYPGIHPDQIEYLIWKSQNRK